MTATEKYRHDRFDCLDLVEVSPFCLAVPNLKILLI